jgi:tetratricopeptide (TPR) repeat protein
MGTMHKQISAWLLTHIRAMVAAVRADFIKEYASQVEGFFALLMEVLVRFGLWDDILAEPDNYADYLAFTRAFHLAARAIAYSAKGDVADARKEQAIYLELAKLVPKDELIGANGAEAVLAIVTPMIEGEISIRDGRPDKGFTALRTAVGKEDASRYAEPPVWMIPVHHSLGASLLQAGQWAEAEQVYRDDLARSPLNGWSLYGLAESLRLPKKNPPEAAATEANFRKIWAKADLQITSSCLCPPGGRE